MKWVKEKDYPKHKKGEVVAKTNYGRNIIAVIKDDGKIDWRNREYDDEKVILLLDENVSTTTSKEPDQDKIVFEFMQYLIENYYGQPEASVIEKYIRENYIIYRK